MTPVLALHGAGRATEADDLRARLAAEPDLITITGGGREELLAFLVCCARESAENDDGALLARIALVDSTASWRALIEHDTPLVLVPMTDAVRQEARGHRFGARVGRAAGPGAGDRIEIDRAAAGEGGEDGCDRCAMKRH